MSLDDSCQAGDDTIFAHSSGAAPCAIAIIRISGNGAGFALSQLIGDLPPVRKAVLRAIKAPRDGRLLDQGLVLWFPGKNSATGEDLAELHLHGGRAVIRAVEAALEGIEGLRRAEAGEFTRRSFSNGRMDLTEAEGLADLLSAETESQRASAIALSSGRFSGHIQDWREEILRISAMIEAELDFSDEDDVEGSNIAEAQMDRAIGELRGQIQPLLEIGDAQILYDGVRVVLAGPPNSGKSTLLNALVQKEAAIVSDIAGTTRDRIDIPVALGGIAFLLTDTAGLRDDSEDEIERIGMARAREAMDNAHLILWLGAEGKGPVPRETDQVIWEIETKSDDPQRIRKADPLVCLSAKSGENLNRLSMMMIEYARSILPPADGFAINQRQKKLISQCHDALGDAYDRGDLLLKGEAMRLARLSLDRLLGNSGTEDMLDSLFGRFCIGK